MPKVLDWGADGEAQWLVIAALPGEGAVMEPWRMRLLDAVRAIAQGLRLLHDTLPVADYPLDWSVGDRRNHCIQLERRDFRVRYRLGPFQFILDYPAEADQIEPF